MENNKEKTEIKPMEVFEKIEFRTMRANRKNNTGTVIIVTPAGSGDMIWEMAKLKCFNQNDKPTFDYNNKTIFALGQLEAAKISIVINRYLASCNRPKQVVEFPHLTASTPKKITFTFSATEDFKTKEKVSQMQVNVLHPSNDPNEQGENYNIYLNEEEMYVVKQFLDAQINPALKRVNAEASRSLKMDKDTNLFKNYASNLIMNINNKIGG
ncbi:MAG: hypothetical protein ACRCXX_13630 [Cetobacterium sp.]|uniref:hypothetical protein n=1 Tax=Cetobacterium sp. TaxID=2071632 RepID=UPI003F2AC365